MNIKNRLSRREIGGRRICKCGNQACSFSYKLFPCVCFLMYAGIMPWDFCLPNLPARILPLYKSMIRRARALLQLAQSSTVKPSFVWMFEQSEILVKGCTAHIHCSWGASVLFTENKLDLLSFKINSLIASPPNCPLCKQNFSLEKKNTFQ